MHRTGETDNKGVLRRHSIKTVLAVAAALVATGATATLAAAASDPAPGPTSVPFLLDPDVDRPWGPVWSVSFWAMARGNIKVHYPSDAPAMNQVHVTGWLYDLDHRRQSEGGKCAYVRFDGHTIGGGRSPAKRYELCGHGKAKPIDFTWSKVDRVRLMICQTALGGSAPIPSTCKATGILP
ncbi:hypothetical protein MF672_042570 [Actinomadura sp. ATCC 31491]|uniref:Uncharacterized protein n=1 Tax=Actinomadura luzonensis TaxID=2805427 RepID=A0ABT0G770_9ACTN|nr:hypothetical protein [Actinomadura luzonensis]MCK2220445.1 hypothetical protein [Actinomadura luzonensis]